MSEDVNVYQPPRAAVLDEAAVQWDYMGLGARALAYIIDGLAVAAITYALSEAGLVGAVVADENGISINAPLWLIMLWSVGFWIWLAATPGKLIFRARIVDVATGKKAAWWRYVVRGLIGILSGFVFGLGYFWAIFQRESRTWHDLAAGTVVVRWDSQNARAVTSAAPTGTRHRCPECGHLCWTSASNPRRDCPACGRVTTLVEY